MPPRQRTSAGAPSATAAPLGLTDLPDDLLLRVLERLPMADRFRCVAPVCQRLCALCLAPQLLRSVEFRSIGDDARQMARLLSLLLFLQRRSTDARSLHIDIETMVHQSREAVAACLGACGARPCLQQLTMRCEYDCGLLLGGMTSLRSLLLQRMTAGIDLHLGQLSRLTALRELHLSGTLLCPGPATKPCLPPSLTALCIEGDLNFINIRGLPPQLLLGLTALNRLTLVECDYSPGSLTAISALTALTCLQLDRFEGPPPPSSFSLLSNLRQLEVSSCVEFMDDVESTVAALPGLTTLALHLGFFQDDDVDVLHLPHSVTALRSLRRLSFSTYNEGPVDLSLPAGPWLAQLRWLGLPWHMAVSAAATLAAATQLQHLCLFALPPYELSYNQGVTAEEWAAVWRMVQGNAPLQRLWYELFAILGGDAQRHR